MNFRWVPEMCVDVDDENVKAGKSIQQQYALNIELVARVTFRQWNVLLLLLQSVRLIMLHYTNEEWSYRVSAFPV